MQKREHEERGNELSTILLVADEPVHVPSVHLGDAVRSIGVPMDAACLAAAIEQHQPKLVLYECQGLAQPERLEGFKAARAVACAARLPELILSRYSCLKLWDLGVHVRPDHAFQIPFDPELVQRALACALAEPAAPSTRGPLQSEPRALTDIAGPALETVNLVAAVGAVLEKYAPLAVARGVTLRAHAGPDLFVRADERLLNRLLNAASSALVDAAGRDGTLLYAFHCSEATRGVDLQAFRAPAQAEVRRSSLDLAFCSRTAASMGGELRVIEQPLGHRLSLRLRPARSHSGIFETAHSEQLRAGPTLAKVAAPREDSERRFGRR